MGYHLDCEACDFETCVEADRDRLLDEIDRHHDEYDSTHVVEFELVDDGEP